MTSKYENSPLALAEASAFSAEVRFFESRTFLRTVVESEDIVLRTYL
jgi:hypothetical protein